MTGLRIPGQLSPSDPKVKKEFETFKQEVTAEATKILSERMPQKILHFNKLVSVKNDGSSESAANPWLKFQPVHIPAHFSTGNVSELSGDSTTTETKLSDTQRCKRRKLVNDSVDVEGAATPPTADAVAPTSVPVTLNVTNHVAPQHGAGSNGAATSCSSSSCGGAARKCTASFPAHPQLYIMTEELKREVSELIEIAGAVKIFIQLNVPRIEGGNNFGVQIQEEAIQELSRVEEAAFSVCSAIVDYFSERASLAKKIIRCPNIQDYREALREHDEKKWMFLRVTRIDMRNNYAMLYDLLSKNWERVVQPRSSNTSSMMY
eukprot:Lankesteria_metandrocarpae@DN4717_c0_g1_i3.p1